MKLPIVSINFEVLPFSIIGPVEFMQICLIKHILALVVALFCGFFKLALQFRTSDSFSF